MFLITTDNKLYYKGKNRYGRGGVGHSNRVLEYEEVFLKDSNKEPIPINLIVDFTESYESSAILLKDGSIYISTTPKFTFEKINLENITQITSCSSYIFALDKDGKLFSIPTRSLVPTQITKVYDGTKSIDINKVKKIGGYSYTYGSAYGFAYFIDEFDCSYTFNYDFTRATYRTNYFSKFLENIKAIAGYYYGTSSAYITAITKDKYLCVFNNANGTGTSYSSLAVGKMDKFINFKTFNTEVQLGTKTILDIFQQTNDCVNIIYRDNGQLKYATTSTGTSYITGETLSCSNKFQEVIPNENNFNFERFEAEIMLDSTYSIMYMWEKGTGDLYMAGRDYSNATFATIPLTKVELPNGEKIKRLKTSKLYKNYKGTVQSDNPILLASMFEDGVFSQEDSGFKVWDGEKFDRAIFVDELEGKYELDLDKGEPNIKIQTSNGERVLAKYDMIVAHIE